MSELDQLDHLARTADEGAVTADALASGQDPEALAQAQAGPDYATEAQGAVDMFAALVVGFAPEAEPVWSDAAKQRTAAALAPVLEKYGFTFGSMPPEITLAIVAGPLVWQSAKIVGKKMNAEQAEAKAKKQAERLASADGQVASGIERAAVRTSPPPDSEAAPGFMVQRHAQMGLYGQTSQR